GAGEDPGDRVHGDCRRSTIRQCDTVTQSRPRSSVIGVMEELRPLLLSIAYRMLGTFGDAEDVVQEAYLRLHREPSVDSPKAFLTTVTTRLAIDQLRSARRQREQYLGPWLPEPAVDEYVDLADRAALSDSLST